MGRIRVRPIEAGRYVITSTGPKTVIYANYYDAGESDISAPPPAEPARPATPAPPPASTAASAAAVQVTPIAPWLIFLALAAMLLESALLTRKAMRWRARDV
jgi:hypothetical protein